jgi:hypothetical protein
MARGPRIIDGARSPAELDGILAKEEGERQTAATLRAAGARLTPQPPAEVPAYPVRFVCEADSLILSLDIPTELPDGAIKHNRFNVKFSQGGVDIRQRAYPFSTKRVSEAIQACSGYGLGRRFWDYDEQERALGAAQKDQQYKIAKAAMKDPELRAALLAEIQADDFDLEQNPQTPGSTP